MAIEDEDPKVTFPVRDLLDQMRRDLGREIGDLRRDLNAKLDMLFTRVDAKADKADVTALQAQVTRHDERLQQVEQVQASTKHHEEQQTAGRRALWPLVVSALVVLVMAVQVWLQYKAYHH